MDTPQVEEAEQQAPTEVSIIPEVAIYGVFKHLNYKPWFALAEPVDNALHSFLVNREAIEQVEGPDWTLPIEIELDRTGEQRLVIRDYAAGIAQGDFQRAFRAGNPPPPNDVKLSEFGVGLKTAASWFAKRWRVRTTALGEAVERTIVFDVEDVIKNKRSDLQVQERSAHPDEHYTVVELEGLHHPLQGRTIGKIREYLASIYRQFIRDGDVEITFLGEPLEVEEPVVLIAPPHDDLKGAAVSWQKPIDIQVDGVRVKGRTWLLQDGSYKEGGLSLFRNRRLIQGAGEEKYRPYEIFKSSNSFMSLRLGGELTIEGLDVSHTKDGFQWGEKETEILEQLRGALEESPLPMITQAKKHKQPPKAADVRKKAQEAADSTTSAMVQHAPKVMEDHANAPDEEKQRAAPPENLPKARSIAHKDVTLEFRGVPWDVHVELTLDPAISDWYSISQRPSRAGSSRTLGIRVSLDHPFVNQFATTDQAHIEPLLRIAVALALAECTAQEARINHPGEVRIILNDLLRNAFWHTEGES